MVKEGHKRPHGFIEIVVEKEEEKLVTELTEEEMRLIRFALMNESVQWKIAKDRAAKEDKPHNYRVSDSVQKAEKKEMQYIALYRKIADFMEQMNK